MPYYVTDSMAVYYAGFIYLPGGRDPKKNTKIDSRLRYNVENDKWEDLNITLKYPVLEHVCALTMLPQIQRHANKYIDTRIY